MKKLSDFKKGLQNFAQDDYVDVICEFGFDFYRERVEMIGVDKDDIVLDAGCGFGQWSVVLAEKCKKVVGIDHSEYMVEASKYLAEQMEMDNMEFRQMSLPALDFPDNSFDFIWCWGVMMFVNRETLLKEFHRVLKPNGRILVGAANSPGRWVYKLLKNIDPRNLDLNTAKYCLRALKKGHLFTSDANYTTKKSSQKLVENYGFKFIASDLDGHIDLTHKNRIKPFFDPKFLGMDGNIEFVAQKQ